MYVGPKCQIVVLYCDMTYNHTYQIPNVGDYEIFFKMKTIYL